MNILKPRDEQPFNPHIDKYREGEDAFEALADAIFSEKLTESTRGGRKVSDAARRWINATMEDEEKRALAAAGLTHLPSYAEVRRMKQANGEDVSGLKDIAMFHSVACNDQVPVEAWEEIRTDDGRTMKRKRIEIQNKHKYPQPVMASTDFFQNDPVHPKRVFLHVKGYYITEWALNKYRDNREKLQNVLGIYCHECVRDKIREIQRVNPDLFVNQRGGLVF